MAGAHAGCGTLDQGAVLRGAPGEQSALRRVATLVAADPAPRSLFDGVCEELGRRARRARAPTCVRFEDDARRRWSARGRRAARRRFRWASIPVEGETVTAKLHRERPPGAGRRLRGRERRARCAAARVGIGSAVGAPIKVGGRLWGAIMAVGARRHAFPADTEQRIGEFAELVTAALANVEAREQLAASRAGSSRPATRSAAGWSATCTTAHSRSWSAPPSASGSRGKVAAISRRPWNCRRRARQLQAGLRGAA